MFFSWDVISVVLVVNLFVNVLFGNGLLVWLLGVFVGVGDFVWFGVDGLLLVVVVVVGLLFVNGDFMGNFRFVGNIVIGIIIIFLNDVKKFFLFVCWFVKLFI